MLEKKLDEHILEDNHKQVNNTYLIEGVSKAIEEIGNKVNQIYNKVYNIS
jgi:hypothetical protein